MSGHDPQIWLEARQRLPLPDLLSALGDGRFREKKSECPFCQAKGGKWGLFKRGGRDFFKCHAPDCVANDPDAGNSEIGYLALRKGIDAREAAKEYLRLALPEREFDFDKVRAPDHHRKGRGKPKDGESPSPPPPALHPAMDGPAQNVWHDLWQRLPLAAIDHDAIAHKRGFSAATIALHGIRSNKLAYRAILEKLAEDYPLSLLIREGLFKEEGRAQPGPSGQFYGYGITGEKDAQGNAIFDLTEPPIIPYFNEAGIPFYLRPHKGGVKKPRSALAEIQIQEDEDDEATCAAEVFVPLGTAELVELNDGRAILTEGEFKAIAGAQAGIPIIAAPGVSFVRNPEFRRKLEAALEANGITELAVIFDNEVKNDPAFPHRYKPDPWNQWDTQVYAEYTLRELRGYFHRVQGSIRVGALPDELRIDGKADFDGILAGYVHGVPGHPVFHTALGLEAGTKAARKAFRRALDDATPAPTVDLFPSESRRVIECKVERMFHTPRVPIGGKREAELARRFAQYDPETGKPIDKELADALEECLGCYYLRKAVTDKAERARLSKAIGHKEDSMAEDGSEFRKGGLKGTIADLEAQLEEAEKARLADPNILAFPDSLTPQQIRARLKVLYAQLAAKWERLKGTPTAISTFTLACEYKLHTASGESVDRLLRIARRRSSRMITEKRLRRATPDNLARLADFRRWCIALGDANFGGSGGGGEKDLQDLVMDMDHHSYLRDIHELDTYGLHAETGIWFFGDCAYPPNGTVIHADKSGIFWHEGTGYQFAATIGDDPTETFCQGAPLLLASHDKTSRASNIAWVKDLRTALAEDVSRHRAALDLADRMLNQTAPADCDALLAAAPPASHAQLRKALCSSMLAQAGDDLFNTLGDYHGWTLLGMMLAYAIGPELTRQGGHPGLWLTGKKSSGKTTIGRWLMRLWGFKELGGIKIGGKASTAVGLGRGFTQYSNLPILCDEYRADTVEEAIEQMLRGAFDRSGGLKGIADASKKTRNPTSKTTPIVMGESSSRDSATRSRYVQIHVSKHQRIGDGAARYSRVQSDCKHWHQLGRCLMENRTAFAASALAELAEWNQSPTIREQIPDERDRLRPGVAYACLFAAAELLGLTNSLAFVRQLAEFHSFLMTQGKQDAVDVGEETFLSRFWADIITARQSHKIDKKFFILKWVIPQDDGVLRPVADGEMIAQPVTGAVRVCFVGFRPVFSAYLAYKASLREPAPLGESDLRRHLEKEPYWVPYPTRKGETVHRIRMAGTKTSCWVISLERQPAADGEYAPYICPFAEDLINVLTPDKDAAAAED